MSREEFQLSGVRGDVRGGVVMSYVSASAVERPSDSFSLLSEWVVAIAVVTIVVVALHLRLSSTREEYAA